MVEILSSLLTFSSYGNGKNMGSSPHGNTSHFVLLLDPSRFGDLAFYKDSIDIYVDSIKNAPLATGSDEIIIPGELEMRSIINRTEHGIELDETVALSIADTARQIGLIDGGQRFEDMLDW
jgi:LDH2 family malate/lactate/ureidoglycolate dehydrogenase